MEEEVFDFLNTNDSLPAAFCVQPKPAPPGPAADSHCLSVADMEVKVQRALAQAAAAQQEAWLAKQEAARLKDELVRMTPRSHTLRASPRPAPSSPLLYRDDPEFAALRAEGVRARVDLLATMPEAVARSRLAEVADRGLTDFEIECSLHRRKELVEEKYASEGLGTDDLAAKVKSRVLQLLRVLHRRRMAILHGHKLPPVGSLFAQLPE